MRDATPTAAEPTARTTTAHVVVRSRDVETYEEHRVEVPVRAASGDLVGRRIIESVQALHPGARRKSLDGPVASFVASKYLVVARYVGPPASGPCPAEQSGTQAPAVQDSLFDG